MNRTGIERIGFYVPRHALRLEDLARSRGVEPSKYTEGLGQHVMAVPAPDEDVVTMGANAARTALQGLDPASIDTLIFATESGIDQSKAAGIFVHRLLGLSPRCRTFEVKQACCSSTAALQMALTSAAARPGSRTLIIASDVARYGFGRPGEPTQGAGALAMVVSDRPAILAIDAESGVYTEDVNDFWRPNYLDEALVDGKYSIRIYLRALEASWKDYAAQTGSAFDSFDRFCYHMPFTRMANKAHLHLAHYLKLHRPVAELDAQVEQSLVYNRLTGNCYTASLYIGLLSLLENDAADLAGRRIGMFSYGSGCMGSFFGGTVAPGYRSVLPTDEHRRLLRERRMLDIDTYERFYSFAIPKDGSSFRTGTHPTGWFRLAGVEGHKRLYETADGRPAAEFSQPAPALEELVAHTA